MKVKTKELQTITEMAFLPFGGDFFIETPRLLVKDDKIFFNDSTLGSVCAGAVFNDIIVEQSNIEEICLTNTLYDMIKGFRGKETSIMIGDDDKIYLESANTKVNEPITEHEKRFSNIKPHYVWTDLGFVPDTFEPVVSFDIDIGELKSLYKSKEYTFIAKENNTISVQFTYEGFTEVKKELAPEEGGVFADQEIVVDADYFNSVISLFSDKVKISFDGIAICVFSNKENQKASYFILCMKE